jgi:hypothetical protein
LLNGLLRGVRNICGSIPGNRKRNLRAHNLRAHNSRAHDAKPGRGSRADLRGSYGRPVGAS